MRCLKHKVGLDFQLFATNAGNHVLILTLHCICGPCDNQLACWHRDPLIGNDSVKAWLRKRLSQRYFKILKCKVYPKSLPPTPVFLHCNYHNFQLLYNLSYIHELCTHLVLYLLQHLTFSMGKYMFLHLGTSSWLSIPNLNPPKFIFKIISGLAYKKDPGTVCICVSRHTNLTSQDEKKQRKYKCVAPQGVLPEEAFSKWMGERIQFDSYLPLSQFTVILILDLLKLLRF